ncbi:polysaccharide biosynthesis tyrosine autokinase [Scytonema hofmannii FACHB-248]|uniref:Polysaccharide biosynthesis tyrosine autokinase n=1 Tax=Scytonema hofmannii FACHB-248 TaxID=1842502 RepID=A0ABR8GUZ1_9CYAN|nr:MULTISPECIES: polysaccharide biosynthesis tyrosine autokinase [Nostocales]MBD2606905.1 polysaccharide biosynthesis tyrosine autokinase [Scytonema hofmannii FACHB-248]
MENNSSQLSSHDQNRNFSSPFLQAQPFTELEGLENDWNFRDFLGILRRRSLIIAGVATLVMAIFVSLALKQKPEYEGNFRLLVEPVNDDSKVVDVVKDANLAKFSLDYESQIQVLKSPELMGDIVKQLQHSYPEIDYDSVLNSLTIIRLGTTKIIEVRYRSNDPNKTKVVLNQIARDYLNYSLEKRQTKLRQGIQFVEKQLPFLQKRVDEIQKSLQIFRQKYDFIDPDSQAQQIANQVNILSGQRLLLNQQLAQARANLAGLQAQDGELAALNNATVYQQLIVQISQLETQIAAESARFQEDSPSIRTLKDKRDNLLPLLQKEGRRFLDVKVAEVATQVQTLEVQSQELAKAEQKLEQRRKQLPVLARQYTEMQRGLQVATESLNRFLTTRETLQIQVAQTELPWQLIQAPSKPESAVSSDIRRSLITGFFGSLAIGIGIAILIEKLDNTYHTAPALKEKIKLPLLGIIPFEKQLQNGQNRTTKQDISIVRVTDSLREGVPGLAVIPDQDYSNYSRKFLEALRVLCTNIQLLSSDRPIRSIIISSAMSGDGKSTVAFHLAQIATAMGQRVLLVDADLRQPTIHTLSNLNNLWGLSNLISTNLPVGEVIRKVPSMNKLSVITSGPIPPDPTKLLSSQKMKRLMEEFHNRFDLVIYDAPVLVGLADASLIAPHTNGILLVVRMDKTDSSVLKRALDNLKLSRMGVLGAVGNAQKNN